MTTPNWPQNIPVWYVVAKQNYDAQPYVTYTIVQAIPCNLSDVDQMYGMYAAPLWNSGVQLTTMIFTREPDTTPITEHTARYFADMKSRVERLHAENEALQNEVNRLDPNVNGD